MSTVVLLMTVSTGILGPASALIRQEVVVRGSRPEEKVPSISDESPLSLPEAPSISLAPPPGFADEESSRKSVAERLDALLRRAESEKDEANGAVLRLRAVNEMLAHALEPAASRALLQAQGASGALPSAEIRKLLDRADDLLAQVDAQPDAAAGADIEPDRRERILRWRETLGAFSAAMRLVLLPSPGQVKGEQDTALRKLARLRERNDPAVAAAAALWQSWIRLRQGEVARVLSSLPPVLLDMDLRRLPYAFYQRLLRGRALSRRGGHAAALSLLLQFEEQLHRQIEDEEQRQAMLRAVRLERFHILRDWFETLDAEKRAAERAWCVARMTRIREEMLGEDGGFYRLGEAVPLFVPSPEQMKAPAENPDAGAADKAHEPEGKKKGDSGAEGKTEEGKKGEEPKTP